MCRVIEIKDENNQDLCINVNFVKFARPMPDRNAVLTLIDNGIETTLRTNSPYKIVMENLRDLSMPFLSVEHVN